MLHFAEQSIPVLPVHDSFIVAKQHKTELIQVMQEVFYTSLKKEIAVSVKE